MRTERSSNEAVCILSVNFEFLYVVVPSVSSVHKVYTHVMCGHLKRNRQGRSYVHSLGSADPNEICKSFNNYTMRIANHLFKIYKIAKETPMTPVV